jgi:hypothetical protein
MQSAEAGLPGSRPHNGNIARRPPARIFHSLVGRSCRFALIFGRSQNNIGTARFAGCGSAALSTTWRLRLNEAGRFLWTPPRPRVRRLGQSPGKSRLVKPSQA